MQHTPEGSEFEQLSHILFTRPPDHVTETVRTIIKWLVIYRFHNTHTHTQSSCNKKNCLFVRFTWPTRRNELAHVPGVLVVLRIGAWGKSSQAH